MSGGIKMGLNEQILKSTRSYLESDELRENIEAQVKQATNEVIKELFTAYNSPIKEIITDNLKKGIVPELQRLDYSDAVLQMESVIKDVMKTATAENNQTLKNFKEWSTFKAPKTIKLSEIFDKYAKFVGENIDTDDLEIDLDDGPAYNGGTVTLKTDRYDSFGTTIELTCEMDNSLNFKLKRYGFDHRAITNTNKAASLTLMSEFEAYLRNLEAHKTVVEMDTDFEEEEVEVQEEPEADFN